MITSKKVVNYVDGTLFFFGIGNGAILTPINHPDTKHVSNESAVWTSPVVDIDLKTGVLETANTIYIPIQQEAELDFYVDGGDFWKHGGF